MKVAAAEINASARWLVWLAVAALGWFLFRQLSLEWRINPQYSYGWVVPFLALYLIAERWRDRPAPAPPLALAGLLWAMVLILPPLRLAQEANPDWRLTSWIASILAVGLLWIGFARAGGAAWWRHFSFASAFILTATPWPTPLENAFVQALMQGVASIAVEALNWMGIAAQQEGNLIRLAGGRLGVDEACSGVRSFQATIMVALFLGELRRLTWKRRVALLGGGMLLALLLNLGRAILLAIVAGRNGITAVERWHDPAGYALLAITFSALWLGARLLDAAAKVSPAAPISKGRWPARMAAIALASLMVSEAATAAWYGWHERQQPLNARWKVEWPYNAPGFAAAPISEGIRLVLRYNHGEAAIWNRPDGSRWHLFFFTWKPGRAAAQLARNHRPETCLPATGFKFVKSRGARIHRVGGLELPVERIEFQKAGQRLHVYYLLWEDQPSTPSKYPPILNRESRLRAIAEGRRHLGQRVLEVVISGIDSPERADGEFAAALEEWALPIAP